jgi:hypothetical protein
MLVPVMITPQEFKRNWERVKGERLILFPETSLSDVRLPSEAAAFLTFAGLPDQAAPFLAFGPPKHGTLERVSIRWCQPPALSRYRIIGSNGSGDPVCLDDDILGQVVYLNHDNRLQRVLMASSVFTLAECLLQLRDLISNSGCAIERIPPKCFEDLYPRLRAIDREAADGYWIPECRGLQVTQ